MEKVDRLGWTAGIVFEALGVEFGVRSNCDDLSRLLEPYLPAAWKRRSQGDPTVEHLYSLKVGGSTSRPGTRNYHLLYSGAARLTRSLELSKALSQLGRDLPARLSQLAPHHTFLKAAALRWHSKVLVVPAEDAGLLQDLQEQGATLLCQDFVMLDEERKFGHWSSTDSERIHTVLFSQFEGGRNRTEFRELSRGESALRLFTLSASALLRPQRDLDCSIDLASRARVGLVLYGPGRPDSATVVQQLFSQQENN